MVMLVVNVVVMGVGHCDGDGGRGRDVGSS